MMRRHQFLLSLHLALALSAPSCRFTGTRGTTFTCRAGTDDYSLRRGLVSDNNRTAVVVLNNCRITDIDFESFDGLPSVHTIDLSSNKIQILKLGILDESRNVKRLNISFNAISEIPLGIFDQMPILEVLDVRGNKLRNLELGVFSPMPKLKHLDISSNELVSERLSPYLLDENTNLTFLNLSSNDMRKLSETFLQPLQVLDSLNLDSCSLDEVPEFAVASKMGNLRQLVLSHNQIGAITNPYRFRNLVGLQILDLTGNKIISLHQNVFKPMRKLSILSLRYNRIQSLPETIFQNLPQLGNLDLSHNAIEYVADTTFQGLPHLKRLNLSINRLTFLPVKFCENLVKSGTNLVKFYFNQNPWQCSCLRDLLREVKKYQLAYNSRKYKGADPVCVEPEYVAFGCKRTISDNIDIINLFERLVKESA